MEMGIEIYVLAMIDHLSVVNQGTGLGSVTMSEGGRKSTRYPASPCRFVFLTKLI